MSGKRVAKRMRRDRRLDARLLQIVLQDAPEAEARNRPAMLVQKQHVFRRFRQWPRAAVLRSTPDERPSVAQISMQCPAAWRPVYEPFLAAFAEHTHQFRFELYIRRLNPTSSETRKPAE